MKNKLSNYGLVLAGVLAAAVGSVSAQSAVSPVVGYRTETIQQGFNLVGFNLHGKVLASGTIDGATGAVVNDASVDFSTILNGAGETYLLEVTSGAQDGMVAEIASAANGSVTLVAAPGVTFAATDTYSVRRALTLTEVFDNLTAGFTEATADVVWIPTGSGTFDRFFKHAGTGNFRAAGTFFDPVKPIAIFYPDACFVERKGSTPIDIVQSGTVKLTSTVVDAPNGFYPVSVSGPAGSTLNNSGLAATLKRGFTEATADVVWVPTGVGSYDRYFAHQISGNFRAAGSFVDAPQVDIDNGVFIERRDPATSAVFQVPSFY